MDENGHHTCKQCNKKFNGSIKLAEHERIHTGEKPFACSQCGSRFRLKGDLTVHERRHTGEKPYTCNMCDNRFISSSTLRKHERTVHSADTVRNDPGKRTSEEKLEDWEHLPFKDVLNVQKYDVKVTQVKTLLKSEEVISDTDSLKKIKRSSKSPTSQEINKQKFEEKTSQKENLVTKVAIKTEDSSSSCKASQSKDVTCKSESENPDLNLTEQKENTGPPSKTDAEERWSYTCAMCDKVLNQSPDFIAHIMTHTGEKVEGAVANFYVEALSQELRAMRVRSEKAKLQQALVSDLENQEPSLELRRAGGKKSFSCLWCNKTFSSGSKMRRHEKTHTGEKTPYSCNSCDKTFTKKYHLQTHERSHSGEKPFKCTECNKQFTQSSNLYKHQRDIHCM